MSVLPPVTGGTFDALAAGGGGAGAVGELRAAQSLGSRLLVRGVATEARAVGHVHADLTGRSYETLAELERHAAHEVERVLTYPAVGAWARRTCRSLRRNAEPGGDDPAALGTLALAAAVRAGLPCEVELPRADGVITLPSLGRVTLPDGAGGRDEIVAVAVRPDRDGALLWAAGTSVRVDPRRDGDGWQVLHRLPPPPGEGLVIDDLDPYRWPAHRDSVHRGPAPRLTPEQRRRWQECAGEAWRLLAAGHRTVAEEVEHGVRVLTPLRTPPRGQDSSSARDTFGTVALSEPRDGLGLAVTLAHEIQHAKLTALTEAVELTVPGYDRRFYAPWRDDPRPVYGLLQGAYAYLGVTEFWRRQCPFERGETAFRAEVEFARWRRGAHRVSDLLLGCGGLTEQGGRFVGRMRAVLEERLSEPVGAAAAAQARLEAERHLRAWRERNPGAETG